MITTEILHFKERLNQNTQKLFVSNIFQITAESITNIFIAAFIWRFTESFYAVAFYQIGFYIALAAGFWVNGILLRKFYLKNIFLASTFLTGATSLIVLFFSESQQVLLFFLIGLMNAFGYGLYWPNRNYLELKEIKDSSRNYYFSLINAVGWTTRALVPFIAGWFIVLGSNSGFYKVETAYWILFIFAFILMIKAGLVIYKGNHVSPKPLIITRFKLQKFLNKRFLLNTSHGVVDGIGFIFAIIILIHLGDEGVLGTLTAVASILGSVVLYFYGKFSKETARVKVSLVSNILFLSGALSLVFLPSSVSFISYILIGSIFSNLYYVGAEPIILAESEIEMSNNEKEEYSFIFDNEFFLNFGRVVGILVFVLLVYVFSQSFALKFGPLLVGLLQLVLLSFYLCLNKRN
ncbi:MAG: MFS transporter [Candidatus Paceibacterota bacterium]